MAKMSQECQDAISNIENIAFSTCSKDGIPNVVPVGMKKVIDDETIMVSDQFMNKSLANIKENPHVALSVWDKNGGFQIKGTVAYESEGPKFESAAAGVNEIFKSIGLDFKSKGICFIHVDAVYSVTPGENAGALLSE